MTHFPLAQWADQKPIRWIFIWCALVVLVVLGSSISVPDFSDKPQVTHVSDQPIQVTQLEKLQAQVGPEGTCTETPKAIQCKNKHGRKVITKAKE